MARTIKFTKIHGASSDYIYVDTTRYSVGSPKKLSKEWNILHTGIGSDGLVSIGCFDRTDFNMRMFNADGSGAKMCGDASRCTGKYLYDYKPTSKTEIALGTLSDIKILELHAEDNKVDTVTVNMSIPVCKPICYDSKEDKPTEGYPIEIDEMRYTGTTIPVGNPYLVIFANDITKVNLPVIGSELGNHPLFPGRINVELARVLGGERIRIRMWERGLDITQACGTGAYTTVVAASLTGYSGRKATITIDGGALTIEWDVITGHVFIIGDVIRAFDRKVGADDE